MSSVSDISPLVDELAARFTRLSDEIWDEPELRWEEHESVRKQIEAAEEFGGRITRPVGGVPTAFMAEWGSGSPTIAFLGEYDALASLSQKADSVVREPDPANTSGNGAGCGHNLLGSGSLLAAVAVAKQLEQHGASGTVRYYGCPAEEAAAGKTYMVAGGAFDGVDAAVTWHPGDAMSADQWLSLAYTQAYFRFRGVAAHAGGMPHLGRSALDAAELMNIGVNFLREHMEDTERIHYAFTDAGGASANVVQPTAELYYIVRSTTVAKMRALYERVVAIAHGAAMMTDTTVEIEFDGACAEVLPNRTLEEQLYANVTELGGVPFDDEDQEYGRRMAVTLPAGAAEAARRKLGFAPDDPRSLFDGIAPLVDPVHRGQMTGSTDVGDVSWTVPTVQIMGGNAALGTPFHAWQLVAQGKSRVAHKGMIHAAKAIGATALDLFGDPALLEAAREEFEAVIAATPYDKPIPEGTVPPPSRPGYRPA
ncbi:amidohydrolase [Nocardioides sp. NPDC126508]